MPVATISLLLALAGSSSLAVPPPVGVVSPSGQRLSLGAIAPGQPVVLIVMRASTCEVCLTQLRILASRGALFEELGAQAVGLIYDETGRQQAALNRAKPGLPIYAASAETLSKLGYWAPHRAMAMPGLIFLDRCGDIDGVVNGRSPGRDESSMVLRELRRLSEEKSQCGILI